MNRTASTRPPTVCEVQTRALSSPAAAAVPIEFDMFGDAVHMPAARTGQQLEFKGILLRNAVIRSKPAADGLHAVPVVCMELKSTLETITHACYAELLFTDSTRKQAEELVKTLTKGREVTVSTPVADMRLVFPHVNSISLKQDSAT